MKATIEIDMNNEDFQTAEGLSKILSDLSSEVSNRNICFENPNCIYEKINLFDFNGNNVRYLKIS